MTNVKFFDRIAVRWKNVEVIVSNKLRHCRVDILKAVVKCKLGWAFVAHVVINVDGHGLSKDFTTAVGKLKHGKHNK